MFLCTKVDNCNSGHDVLDIRLHLANSCFMVNNPTRPSCTCSSSIALHSRLTTFIASPLIYIYIYICINKSNPFNLHSRFAVCNVSSYKFVGELFVRDFWQTCHSQLRFSIHYIIFEFGLLLYL